VCRSFVRFRGGITKEAAEKRVEVEKENKAKKAASIAMKDVSLSRPPFLPFSAPFHSISLDLTKHSDVPHASDIEIGGLSARIAKETKERKQNASKQSSLFPHPFLSS